MSDLRNCSKCGVEKPLADFHRDKAAKDGRSARCKVCAIQATKKWIGANRERARASVAASKARNADRVRAENRRYREKNKEQILTRMREFKARNRERIRVEAREWARLRRKEKPELSRIACRRYYEKNADTMREKGRQYARLNPEKSRSRVYARRAAKKGAPVRERVYRSVLWRRDGGKCHICGQGCDPLRWDMDHVTPLSRGGDHSYANIRVSHPACNNRKRARLMTELQAA